MFVIKFPILKTSRDYCATNANEVWMDGGHNQNSMAEGSARISLVWRGWRIVRMRGSDGLY